MDKKTKVSKPLPPLRTLSELKLEARSVRFPTDAYRRMERPPHEAFVGVPPVPHEEVARRLTLLADKIAVIPARRLNMTSWVSTDYRGNLETEELRVTVGHSHACGTAACALGWASTIPELDLVLYTTGMGSLSVASTKYKMYDTLLRGTDAGSVAFGITLQESAELFTPEDMSHVSRAKVVGRIRQLAARYSEGVTEVQES